MAWKRDDRKISESYMRKACDLGHLIGCGNLAGVLTDRKDKEAKAIAQKGCDVGSYWPV